MTSHMNGPPALGEALEGRGYLRFRGKVMRDVLLPRAELEVTLDRDVELADAVSNAHVKKVGGGWQAFLYLTPDEIERLAHWLPPKNRDEMFRHAGELRIQLRSMGGVR